MRNASKTWSVVLAGGEGNRLKSLTTTERGQIIPKQYCSFQRDTCLMEDAIIRAKSVALDQHVCSVVAADHRRWWTGALSGLPDQNVFVQPQNRGTAHGILFALLQIERRAPDSVVVILPADHCASDEITMARSLRMAANLAAENQDLIYILGAEPDRPDDQLGYIVPSERKRDAASGVVRFVEKPEMNLASQLLSEGALWNTFLFAGSVRALLGIFDGRFAGTIAQMRATLGSADSPEIALQKFESLYKELPLADFARDVLEGHEQHLQVLRVPECGWTDLGTPARVEEALRKLARSSVIASTPRSHTGLYLDLARC